MTDQRFAFLGFRRGGSSISFGLLQRLVLASGLRSDDIVIRHYNRGIPIHDIPADALNEVFRNNELVGCFRGSPEILDKVTVAPLRHILVVRDPRDCYASWFHARHLHSEGPLGVNVAGWETLETFIRQPDSFDRDVLALVDYARRHDALILKYEDIIQDPVMFLTAFAGFTGLPLKREAMDAAVVGANFLQLAQDDATHNRSGAPYEALRRLPSWASVALNERFAAAVALLEYPRALDDIPELPFNQRAEIDALKRYIMVLADQNARRMAEINRLRERIESLSKSSAASVER